MKSFFFALMLFAFGSVHAQTELFEDESSVINYMDGKTFYNADNGLEIQYGYMPSYNTYGITAKNKNGVKFYFINVEITTYGSFADLYGMGLEDGKTFGFRLYKGRLVVGRGEAGEQTFYLKRY